MTITCQNCFSEDKHRMIDNYINNYDFKNNLIIGMTNVKDYDLSKYNGVDYYYMSRLINEITKIEAINSKSIFIDLDNELNFDITKDFYDTTHHSESGTEKIGKYLYLKLKDIF